MSATVIKVPFRPDKSVLEALRRQIHALEYSPDASAEGPATISLGAAEIDDALPWNGLPARGLHEVFGDTAALGFCAVLLARLSEVHPQGPILWCQQGRDLYGQGLAEFGIDPDRLIIVHGRNDTDILWAMEEGLRTPGLAAVIGKLHKIPPIAGRRLQLAAEDSGTAGIILRPQFHPRLHQGGSQNINQAATSAALTRWRVTSAPSITPAHGTGLGAPQWNLELQRSRLSAADSKKLEKAGKPHFWQVEWCDETGNLSVVSDLCDGSVEPLSYGQAAS